MPAAPEYLSSYLFSPDEMAVLLRHPVSLDRTKEEDRVKTLGDYVDAHLPGAAKLLGRKFNSAANEIISPIDLTRGEMKEVIMARLEYDAAIEARTSHGCVERIYADKVAALESNQGNLEAEVADTLKRASLLMASVRSGMLQIENPQSPNNFHLLGFVPTYSPNLKTIDFEAIAASGGQPTPQYEPALVTVS